MTEETKTPTDAAPAEAEAKTEPKKAAPKKAASKKTAPKKAAPKKAEPTYEPPARKDGEVFCAYCGHIKQKAEVSSRHICRPCSVEAMLSGTGLGGKTK